MKIIKHIEEIILNRAKFVKSESFREGVKPKVCLNERPETERETHKSTGRKSSQAEEIEAEGQNNVCFPWPKAGRTNKNV